MDAAAPPVLLFRRRSTLDRLRLDPELEIGAGGEAVVYGVPGDDSLVAKLYHEPSIDRARKLAAMLSNPPAMPAQTAIAWPADVLLAERGGFAGFLMPRAEGPRVFEFYNPVTRRGTAPGFHAGLLHRAGRNLAAAFHALHAAGYVVGDVNESNLLVHPADAAVTLVDADSLQVRDGEGGGVFRSRVGKPEFTPPELLGVHFGEVDRTPEHDRFGLAVLLYLLLMEGTHPFAARMEADGEAAPVEERIRHGLFPHASPDDDCHPPRLSPPFEALHPPLQELFLRTFVAGHADPAARPSCDEWCDALEAAEAALVICTANLLHRFAPHLDACPWCERTALLGGRDPFPERAQAAPARPRPARVRAPARFPVAAPFAPTRPSAPVVTPYGTRAPTPAPTAPMMFGPTGLLRSKGAGLPLVFSRDGLLHPLVLLAPSAAVVLMGHGLLQVIGGLGAVLALAAIRVVGWKRTSSATTILAVLAFFCAAILVGLGSSVAADPHTPAGVESGYTTPTPEPQPLPDPLSVRNIEDYMIPELQSSPLHEQTEAIAEVPAVPTPGTAVNVRQLDHWPQLLNQTEAALMLAGNYRRTSPGGDRADTALVWLRVEAGGQVGGVQVISATRPEMADAARSVAGALVFDPGDWEGLAYPAWVVMRFVIVP